MCILGTVLLGNGLGQLSLVPDPDPYPIKKCPKAARFDSAIREGIATITKLYPKQEIQGYVVTGKTRPVAGDFFEMTFFLYDKGSGIESVACFTIAAIGDSSDLVLRKGLAHSRLLKVMENGLRKLKQDVPIWGSNTTGVETKIYINTPKGSVHGVISAPKIYIKSNLLLEVMSFRFRNASGIHGEKLADLQAVLKQMSDLLKSEGLLVLDHERVYSGR